MRIYRLADVQMRKEIDLRDYENLIVSIITSVVPDADVVVGVSEYTIMTDISKGQAIKIGRALAHSRELGFYSVNVHSLKLQISHRAGCVLGESLVDFQTDLCANLHFTRDKVIFDYLLYYCVSHCNFLVILGMIFSIISFGYSFVFT